MLPEQIFRALADETRLRCIMLILQAEELCVCDIAQILGQVQPKISRHLSVLRSAGLVLDRRSGVWVYYRVHPQLPDWVRQILFQTQEGLGQSLPFRDDYTRFTTQNQHHQRM